MSASKAIKAKCIDCIYDPAAEGTNLQQTEGCKITTCPLYDYRPLTAATKKAQRTHTTLISPEGKRERVLLEDEQALLLRGYSTFSIKANT